MNDQSAPATSWSWRVTKSGIVMDVKTPYETVTVKLAKEDLISMDMKMKSMERSREMMAKNEIIWRGERPTDNLQKIQKPFTPEL